MAKAPPIRPPRDILPLRGIGGYLEFYWPTTAGGYPEPGVTRERLEVQRWEIDHKYINVELPESGGLGAVKTYRVADGFEFAAELDIDLTPIVTGGPGPGPGSQPFPDGRMQGSASSEFRISLRLQCGDPTWVSDPKLQSVARITADTEGVYYNCTSVALKNVRIIDSSMGDDVVRAIVRGSGSDPLERFVNGLSCGKGSFGLG